MQMSSPGCGLVRLFFLQFERFVLTSRPQSCPDAKAAYKVEEDWRTSPGGASTSWPLEQAGNDESGRLWCQAVHPVLPPVASNPSLTAGSPLFGHSNDWSDPEDGTSVSSLSDGAPSPPHRRRQPSPEAASAPSTSTLRSRGSSASPAPTRLSPSGLQHLITSILEPAELKHLPAIRPIAVLEPPDTKPPPAPIEVNSAPQPVTISTEVVESPIEEAAEEPSTSATSRMSERSTAPTRTAKSKIVHHVRHHGHARSNLRRNMSERAIANAALHLPTTKAAAAAAADPVRPALTRRPSSSENKKTVRIVEAPAMEMSRTSSRDGTSRMARTTSREGSTSKMARTTSQDGPPTSAAAHHRKSSSLSLHSSRSGSSHASLTTLEPQTVIHGFQPISGSSIASSSRSPPLITASSPVKPSSLRQSIVVRPPSPEDPAEPVTPQHPAREISEERTAKKSNMFFVGSENHDDGDDEEEDDTSSGWGSDHEDDEAPIVVAPTKSRLSALGGGHLRGASMPHLPLDDDLFRKRPVKSSADLVAAGAPRLNSQSTLTLSLLNPPTSPLRPTGTLTTSKSANHVPSRRLGGRPEGIEMDSDSESEAEEAPARTAALGKGKAIAPLAPKPSSSYRFTPSIASPLPTTTLSRITAQQVAPIRSPGTVRKDMVNAEMSASLRTNVFHEHAHQPAYLYWKRDAERLAAQAAKRKRREEARSRGEVLSEDEELDRPAPEPYFDLSYHRRCVMSFSPTERFGG